MSANTMGVSNYSQQNSFMDFGEQRSMLIMAGIGAALLGLLRLRRRSSNDSRKRAKQLMKDLRKIDSVDDARDRLQPWLAPYLRPMLMAGLRALEAEVDDRFDMAERMIKSL